MDHAEHSEQHYPLVEIVVPESLQRFCQAAADLHLLGVAVADHAGAMLAHAPVPGDPCDHLVSTLGQALAAGQAPSTLRCNCGLIYEVSAVRHQAHPRVLGWLVLGPAQPDEQPAAGDQPTCCAPEARRVASGLSQLLAVMVNDGHGRCRDAMHHNHALEQAYQQLSEQNARLAQSLDQLKSLDRLKSNFVATMSHELRTPLTSVIGYSEMLLEGMAGELAPTQLDFVQVIMEKGEQLLQIITEVLDISKIESGAQDLRQDWVAPADVLAKVLEAKRPEMLRRQLEVASEVPPQLPVIWVDRAKLHQVLANLLSNALKFTPPGGQVSVALEVRAGQMFFRVTDSGVGIPRSLRKKVFEEFYQVDNSSTREYGGTGLGLAIVKNFIEAHGGQVWVDPELSEGTQVVVWVPVNPPPREEQDDIGAGG